MTKLPVYIFNTETITKPKYINLFKTYFFLASGFKDLFILSKLNLCDKSIIYYDINPDSIKFKKWILTEWNGKKKHLYRKIMKYEYKYALSDYKFIGDFNQLSLKKQFDYSWKIEMKRWGNNKPFDILNNLKQHSYKFFNIDIASDLKKLKNIISLLDGPIYFWFSNCFNFEYRKTVGEINFKEFVYELSCLNKTIYLSGKDHTYKILECFI